MFKLILIVCFSCLTKNYTFSLYRLKKEYYRKRWNAPDYRIQTRPGRLTRPSKNRIRIQRDHLKNLIWTLIVVIKIYLRHYYLNGILYLGLQTKTGPDLSAKSRSEFTDPIKRARIRMRSAGRGPRSKFVQNVG